MLDVLILAQDPQIAVYLALTLSHTVAVAAMWRWHRLMLLCYLVSALAYGMAVLIHAQAHLPPSSPVPAAVGMLEREAMLPGRVPPWAG